MSTCPALTDPWTMAFYAGVKEAGIQPENPAPGTSPRVDDERLGKRSSAAEVRLWGDHYVQSQIDRDATTSITADSPLCPGPS